MKQISPLNLIHKKGKFGNLSADLEKKLHVSPFWGMDHQYEWLFTQPDSNLLVNMKNFKDGEKVFSREWNEDGSVKE